jgi:A/G-specific adenine glycosylase
VGLWSFPEYTDENEQNSILARLAVQSDNSAIQLGNIRHTFSHFHLEIKPRLQRLDKLPALLMEKPGVHWYDLRKPSELGLAAPVKTLLGALEKAL